MAFAQDLGADERLRFAFVEAVEGADQPTFLTRGVAVEDIHCDFGEIAAETFLHFFRAEADRLEDFAVAQWTERRNRLAQSAVVADQHSIAAVNGQCHTAIAAAELVTAFAA